MKRILLLGFLAAVSFPAPSSFAQTPVADSRLLTWAEDQAPGTNQLTGNNGQTNFIFLIDSVPVNGTVFTNAPYNTPTTGRYKYQPYLNTNWYRPFVYLDVDSPHLTFRVVSGGATSQVAAVYFDITNINDAPFAHDQVVRIPTNQSVAITLTGDDDGDSPFYATTTNQNWHYSPRDLLPTNAVFTILTQPTNGTLGGTAPNVTYQPNLNAAGTDRFTFKVTDSITNGLDSNIATVRVQIASVTIPEGGTLPLHTNSPFTFSRIRPGFTNLVFSGNGRRDDEARNFVFGSANADRYNQPVCFNLYGIVYTNFWLNNNGMISFALSNAIAIAPGPFPLSPSKGPIIAPYWNDVDTLNPNRGGVVTWGTGYVKGRRAIGFTWNDVGCYNQNTNKLNRFQVVLIDRSDLHLGAFEAEFNYDYLEWLTGSAFPTVYPLVGFDGGDSVHYVNTPNSFSTNIANYLINGAPAGRVTYLITTAGPPSFVSEPFVTAEATNATIFPMVDFHTGYGAVELHWGTTTNYGFTNVLSAIYYKGQPILGDQFQITVNPATTYQFSFLATNEVGFAQSTNYTFATLSPPIIVSNGPAVAGPSATVNPYGRDTTVWFEWGSTTNYGHVTTNQDIGSGTNAVAALDFSAFGGGTHPYRAIATNYYGITYGSNGTFRIPYNVRLTALQVIGFAFNEGAFDSTGQTTNYTLTLPSSTGAINISATPQNITDAYLSYQLNGGGYTTNNNTMSLNLGTNIINVRVNANDDSTNKTYKITVNRVPSSNAKLANIALDSGALSPPFNPLTNSYNATVDNDVSSTFVTATAQYSNAFVRINGGSYASGGNTGTMPLSFGGNLLTITVLAEDSVTVLAYSVNITRAFNTNGILSALTLSDGTLSPAFSPGILAYAATVNNSVSNVIVGAATTNAYATIQVNDSTYQLSTNSWPVTLTFGTNLVPVRVKAQDGSEKTYTLSIARTVSPPHFDSVLVLTNGQVRLQISGDPGTYWIDYAADLTNWSPLASITNAGGIFEFVDPETNQSLRFYRARSP